METRRIDEWFQGNDINSVGEVFFANWAYVYFAGPKKTQVLCDLIMTVVSFFMIQNYGALGIGYFSLSGLLGFLMDGIIYPIFPQYDLPFYSYETLLQLQRPQMVRGIIAQ